MLRTLKTFFFVVFCLGTASCAQTVDPVAEQPKTPVVQSDEIQEELTEADFHKSVLKLVRSLDKSSVLLTGNDEKGKVRILRIVDTTKKFDVNQIRREVQATLRMVTKKATVMPLAVQKSDGTPDFLLSGRITSRVAYVRGKKKRTEYYLYLTLSEARTGINLWEGDAAVVKNKRRRPATKPVSQNASKEAVSTQK